MSKRSLDAAFPKLSGVRYDEIVDRQIGDKRFEREKAYKENSLSRMAGGSASAPSSTFDAFQRMAAGLDGRTLMEKISDPNRPTWEQYRKENADKLDLVGSEVRKMVEYRAELDKERNARLKERKHEVFVESSDESEDSSRHTKKKKAKKHKSKKSGKKEKKEKKSKDHKSKSRDSKHTKDSKKRRKRDRDDDSDSSSQSSDDSRSGSSDSEASAGPTSSP